MKRIILALSMPVLALLASAGCQSKSASSIAAAESVEIGPKYSSNSGLLVPPETRQSLGLKIVEVTEQRVPATLDVSLRIYQVGKETVLASTIVTPEEASSLRRGQPVQVQLSNGKWMGRVTSVKDDLQKATGMVEVLVELGRTLDPPVTDAFLPAHVVLDSSATAVSIPRPALLECADGYSVYTVSGEYLVRAPVKVGAIASDLVEIKDGLYAGDLVVLQPVMSLWMTELAAVKGGQACCVVPAKGK